MVNKKKNQQKQPAAVPCQWEFNAPVAPHTGGLWEAVEKSVKSQIFKVMGVKTFSYKEFITIIVKIEAFLNSKPLVPMNKCLGNLQCLTPGNFLIYQTLLGVPEENVFKTAYTNDQRWKLLREIQRYFGLGGQRSILKFLIYYKIEADGFGDSQTS